MILLALAPLLIFIGIAIYETGRDRERTAQRRREMGLTDEF